MNVCTVIVLVKEPESERLRCDSVVNWSQAYKADINIPVRYSDLGSISNMRDVLEYMTKIEQKNALLMYGCNEVHERPLTGRPRSNSTLIWLLFRPHHF